MDRKSAPSRPRFDRARSNCGTSAHWQCADWLLLLSLVGLTALVFWRLALTDLIIGRGDLFFYFYPYRDFASQAIRNGTVPLWNPYSFMGVPFLANSQAGFFYPPNILLAWLPVARSVNVSLVVHASLAAFGTYLWARARLGLTRTGAWLAALVYGLGGYFVAQIEHLNQVQVLAWPPWLLWVYDHPRSRGNSSVSTFRETFLRLSGLAIIIALQVFAGHIQSVFICLVGLAGYALLPVSWKVIRRRAAARMLILPLGTIFGAALLGGILAAAQLVPTYELSGLSIRSGGLPFDEAVSFSLAPDLLPRALLPSWGSPLFPEYVAYIGVVALGLAVFGARVVAWMQERDPSDTSGVRPMDNSLLSRDLACLGALFLALLGLFLALGGYNPIYVVLVKLVPGFASFRAPARWLVLYAVGMSGLAGIGFDAIANPTPDQLALRFKGSCRRWWVAGLVVLTVATFWAFLGELLGGERHRDLVPALEASSPAGWLVASLALVIAVCLIFSARWAGSRRLLRSALVILVVLELLAASMFLPLNRATARGALTSLRPAVAHLLGAKGAAEHRPADRFLSISDILFDPGDKKDLEIILGPQLSDEAVYDYLIATKQKEVLIPNLPLYYRLPAMDGYDGGVLPLRRYVTLEQLILPEGRVAIDGRLREHLDTIPEGRWLSLFNVKYVITDKVGDAWHDDVFYDMQMGAQVEPGSEERVGYVPSMAATALGVVFATHDSDADAQLAVFDVTFSDGQRMSLPLLGDDSQDGKSVARLNWDRPASLSDIRVRGVPGSGTVNILGMSLIDERTGAFFPVTLSDSGRYRLVHSGDVKIFENLDVIPRASFVPHAVFAADDEEALALMRDPSFDPESTVVLSADNASSSTASTHVGRHAFAGSQATIEILQYEPERVVVRVDAQDGGWLVLTDAWYPGWQASLDGERVPVERANILFRAVWMPEGEHELEWRFRPATFRFGALLSLSAVSLLLVTGLWIWKKSQRTAKLACKSQ